MKVAKWLRRDRPSKNKGVGLVPDVKTGFLVVTLHWTINFDHRNSFSLVLESVLILDYYSGVGLRRASVRVSIISDRLSTAFWNFTTPPQMRHLL